MIITDMSYLENAIDTDELEGGFDFSLNGVMFNQETISMTQVANAGVGGVSSGLSSTKSKINTGSISVIYLS